MNSSEEKPEVVAEHPPFLRIYKDGSIERYRPIGFIPPGLDAATGVESKDVTISPEIGISARLYLPPDVPLGKKLPIVIYFHGGGFCIGSAFSIHHHFVGSLVAAARVIAVSVEYRLAPEHPVPAGHRDSWAATLWVVRQAREGEPWLATHGDFDRVFFAGESAGANHAHHMAMAASGFPAFGSLLPEVKLRGLILVHPAFSEPNATAEKERLWKLVCPDTTLPDDPIIDFSAPSAPDVSRLSCRRVLVCTAEKDHLRNAGLRYHETLVGRRWDGVAELFETGEEGHVFFIFKPESAKAFDLMAKIVSFINRDD